MEEAAGYDHASRESRVVVGAWPRLAEITETDDACLVEIELPGISARTSPVEVVGTELHSPAR